MPQMTASLQHAGALVNVLVGLGHQDVRMLRRALRPIPQPVAIEAILDTGAEATCLDASIIRTLSLPVDFPTLANMPSGPGLIFASQYRASVTIQHPSDPGISFTTADLVICELPLGALGYNAVIGRDILDRLRFTYDGPARSFTLEWS